MPIVATKPSATAARIRHRVGAQARHRRRDPGGRGGVRTHSASGVAEQRAGRHSQGRADPREGGQVGLVPVLHVVGVPRLTDAGAPRDFGRRTGPTRAPSSGTSHPCPAWRVLSGPTRKRAIFRNCCQTAVFLIEVSEERFRPVLAGEAERRDGGIGERHGGGSGRKRAGAHRGWFRRRPARRPAAADPGGPAACRRARSGSGNTTSPRARTLARRTGRGAGDRVPGGLHHDRAIAALGSPAPGRRWRPTGPTSPAAWRTWTADCSPWPTGRTR